MNVLITGIAGFVGSHLTDRLLNEGHDVWGIDDFSNGSFENIRQHQSNPRFKFLETDVSKRTTYTSKFDVVYHLACHPRSKSFDKPRRDVEVNLIGTLNILNYCRLYHPRIVFSSNSGIYDSRVQPIKEGNPENPVTPYDVNKLAAEHMIKAYSASFGFPYTIFRFATVYGPRQRISSEWNPVISTFIKTLKEGGKPYITGDGSQTRDFVNVQDVVEALVLTSQMKTTVEEPILLGSGVETSILELYTLVQEELGIKREPEWRPRPLGEILRMSYDCSLAERVLGWKPKISLREGIRIMKAQTVVD